MSDWDCDCVCMYVMPLGAASAICCALERRVKLATPPLSLDDEADYTAPGWLLMAWHQILSHVQWAGIGLDWIGVMGIVEEWIEDFCFWYYQGNRINANYFLFIINYHYIFLTTKQNRISS